MKFIFFLLIVIFICILIKKYANKNIKNRIKQVQSISFEPNSIDVTVTNVTVTTKNNIERRFQVHAGENLELHFNVGDITVIQKE